MDTSLISIVKMYTNLWQTLNFFLLVGFLEVEWLSEKVKHFKSLDTHCQIAWQRGHINLHYVTEWIKISIGRGEETGFLEEGKF